MDNVTKSILSTLPPEELRTLKSMDDPRVRFDQATNKMVVYDGSIKPKRLSVSLPPDIYQQLKSQADMHNVSIAELARNAIERDLYLQGLINQGFKLLYQDDHGKLHRLFPKL